MAAKSFSKALKAKKLASAAGRGIAGGSASVASSATSAISRITKPLGVSSTSTVGKWINWILIIALAALLVFTIVYVVNIHKMANKMEGFIEDASAKPANTNAGAPGSYKLVYVYSKTCPHCVEFTPTFDEFTRQLSSQQPLASKINVEKVERSDPSAAAYLKMVEGFPTVLLLKDNELKEMIVGKTDLSTIKSFVEKNVSA